MTKKHDFKVGQIVTIECHLGVPRLIISLYEHRAILESPRGYQLYWPVQDLHEATDEEKAKFVALRLNS